MANYYTDNKDLKFHLTHPLMEKIVRLKERNFEEKKKFDFAPMDYEDAQDSFDKVLEVRSVVKLLLQMPRVSMPKVQVLWMDMSFMPAEPK
jgi:hypothetical protein